MSLVSGDQMTWITCHPPFLNETLYQKPDIAAYIHVEQRASPITKVP